ncbi:MAG: FlgD immunoglobulin-like domain containing protein [Bacteroidota bacterium]
MRTWLKGRAEKFLVSSLIAPGFAVLFSIFTFIGCDRQIPLPSEPVVSGYQIRGTVKDRLDNAVPYLEVRLYYTFDRDYDHPAPTDPALNVTDSTQTITASVYTGSEALVKTIFGGTHSVGRFYAAWDTLDQNGNPVLNGVYSVRYFVNTQLVKSYPVVVSGRKATATDALGQYQVNNEQLPVDFGPFSVYRDTTFLGNFVVTSYVTLEFKVPQGSIWRYPTLDKDAITYVDVKIQ